MPLPLLRASHCASHMKRSADEILLSDMAHYYVLLLLLLLLLPAAIRLRTFTRGLCHTPPLAHAILRHYGYYMALLSHFHYVYAVIISGIRRAGAGTCAMHVIARWCY